MERAISSAGWLAAGLLHIFQFATQASAMTAPFRAVTFAGTDGTASTSVQITKCYTPDINALRFPSIETVTALKPKQTITGLLDFWWQEAKATGRSQKTYDTYKGAVDRLVKHLGHEDAGRVTEQDMLAFKDARLKVVTAKSLKDGDLPGIRSVFGWAVDNRKLTKNPADAIRIKAEKKIRTRSKGFTDQEATAIFKACLGYVRKPKEDVRTAAAKRWAPLIAAYTGCRIAEALQLRREDVRPTLRLAQAD